MFDNRRCSKIKNSNIQSWRIELAEFSYTIQYREGKTNTVPDSFTRAYFATAQGCQIGFTKEGQTGDKIRPKCAKKAKLKYPQISNCACAKSDNAHAHKVICLTCLQSKCKRNFSSFCNTNQ